MLLEPYKNLQSIFCSEEDAIKYLFNKNIIKIPSLCEFCFKDIKYYEKLKIFQCKNYKCRKKFSIFKNTIFYDLKLPINIILHLAYEFIKKTPRKAIAASLLISKPTITQYYKLFRKIMKKDNKNNIKIGGKNDIVEIDESKSAKRKYNKGHRRSTKITYFISDLLFHK